MLGRRTTAQRGAFLPPSASFGSMGIAHEPIMRGHSLVHVRVRQGEGRLFVQMAEGRKYALIASQQTRTLHVLGLLVNRNSRVRSENGEVPEHWAKAGEGQIGVVYRWEAGFAPQFFLLDGVQEHRAFIAQNAYQSAKCDYAVVEPVCESEAERIGGIILGRAQAAGLLSDWSASIALAVANRSP